MSVETVPVEALTIHPDNPRLGDVKSIVQSIERNGWYGTIVAQRSTSNVLAGNHRLKAAMEAGVSEVPVYWVDVDDATARRIMLADNRTAELATYDDELLADLLKVVQQEDGLLGTGWIDDDIALLDSIIEQVPGPDDNEPTREEINETRTLEGLEDVSIEDPEFIPEKGSVWELGEHILVVCDMMNGWPIWKDYLEGNRVFCPYPGPYVAVVSAYKGDRLLMVQPDRYLAGHVLSKWNAAQPEARQVNS